MESQSWNIEREGRAWEREAMSRFQMAPAKIEMIHGRLFASQEERLAMLALLLENVGTDEAVRLGDPAIWRSAVAALDRPGGAGADRRAFAPVLTDDDRLRSEETLLANLRVRHEELQALLQASSDHWGFEDPVYRFYHQSFKTYSVQDRTESVVRQLADLVPGRPLHPWFLEIVANGTGKQFSVSDNARWTEVTRPMLEAFFHARFFLEMAVRYGELPSPPRPLPSGYAALLYLYQLR